MLYAHAATGRLGSPTWSARWARSPRPMPAPPGCWASSTDPAGSPPAEAVGIGILEATVHLDLQRALEVPPDVPRAGLEHTVGLVATMTPPVDFIELATGRSQVAVFPVLR